MKFKVEVDKSKCIGCGSCVAICPKVFRMSVEGKAEAVTEEIEELGCAKTAEEGCPVKAIKITPKKEE